MLLSDPATQQFLSANVISAWESVAPVPKVTIDLGNGKVLKRTLGGNTIFSLLTSAGNVVDAYPGVYLPRDFQNQVRSGLDLLARNAGKPSPRALVEWHQAYVNSVSLSKRVTTTMSKSGVESPVLNTLGVVTQKVASLGALERMDLSKIPLSARQFRGSLGIPAEATPEEVGQQLVTADSLLNVTMVRPLVHLYLARQGEIQPSVRTCRDALYKDLLHIPLDDPYLGLRDALVPGTK